MKVLIVCSGTALDFNFEKHQAFIYDQVKAIKQLDHGIIFHTFFIRQKGIKGYLQSFPELKREIRQCNPDIIHSHGGSVALLSNLQRQVPVITTFHGSDININRINWISAIAGLLSYKAIYVNNKLHKKAISKKKTDVIIPCGIDMNTFYPLSQEEARTALEFPKEETYILFCSQFNNPIKNYSLASKALKLLPPNKVIEIVNRTREEVNLLINGASLVLLTSFSEGSPSVIKEAMACNCPIVSVDVGDVKEVIGNTEGCFITSYDPKDVAEKIKLALAYGKRTNGRENINHLESSIIAGKIVEVYKSILSTAKALRR